MTARTPPARAGRSALGAVLLCLVGMAVAAEPSTPTDGSDLANRVHYRPRGKDQTMLTTMTLSGGGQDRVRELYQYRRDGERRGDTATLVRFVSPPDIAGTGLLTIDRAGRDDSDQWVFLPDLGRERRVSSDRKGGRFVGSDFYFEDLRDRDPAKDRHQILGTVDLDGKKRIMLESVPVDPGNSVYSKRIGWIDPATYTPMRLDYFVDGRTEPVKRYRADDVKKIDGYWLVTDRSMTDLQTGTSTRLQDRQIRNDRGLPDSLFTQRVLVDTSQSAEREWRP